MKVVFFGNEKLATGITTQPVILNTLERAGYEIEAEITRRMPMPGSLESRLGVLAAFGKIVPQAWLDRFPLGIINVHPSLLPLYRGSTPIEQTILDGTEKTGVSIMHLTSDMDEGPLYKQKTVHLAGTETKQQLADQLQRLGAELLVEVLPGVVDGTLKPRQQPHPDRATYARQISKADGRIDWSKSAVLLERAVRAYAGWPGSYTELASREVTITAARVSNEKPPKQLAIQAGDGKYLVIDKIKPAGKREMSGREFLAGNPI